MTSKNALMSTVSLWWTYPKSPKMNAHCERFKRTTIQGVSIHAGNWYPVREICLGCMVYQILGRIRFSTLLMENRKIT